MGWGSEWGRTEGLMVVGAEWIHGPGASLYNSFNFWVGTKFSIIIKFLKRKKKEFVLVN